MKALLFIVLSLIVSINCIAQKPDYNTTLNSFLEEYNIKNHVIQDTLLNENIATAFNYVIFSGSDLVSNSSAFGYSQNEEKTNVSVSSNLRLGKELSPLYTRIGANASGSKNVFEFYSEGSWSNNVSFNLGLILKIGNASVFFKGGKKEVKKFKEINDRRKINASEPLYKTEKYTQQTIDTIDALKKDILDIKDGGLIQSKYSGLLVQFPDIKKLIEGKKYEEAYSSLIREEKKIQDYIDAHKSQKEMEDYLKNDILYTFDKANDLTYGYSLMWFDINLNLGNSTYKFSESNVDESILEEFGNVYDLTKDINKLKSVLALNFNHSHNADKTIWFYQIGLSTTSSSFLENVLINGTPKIIRNESQEFVFQDEDNQVIGDFVNVKENFKTGAFNAYGAIFFTEKKNFGFNVTIGHNYLIDKPNGTFYKNNFTTLFGPVFRKEKDGETKLTFGIDLGWSNAIYNTRVSDDFTGRIRVGIPFNIYSKKKSKIEA
ncbi:hypothetical protein NO995_00755 [Aestuariibaculum sp. M13]|uniref:hypothetical protein n=1 Tax=Aestuariibaculum sp. M13 TaxID=2967132 RepID=UPI002159F04E|nr:hypothetical protein [Aestuariibaculum sp. M13]MCR8666200.1 hypothetical protein [Aestuariibaculum sp. M13]